MFNLIVGFVAGSAVTYLFPRTVLPIWAKVRKSWEDYQNKQDQ